MEFDAKFLVNLGTIVAAMAAAWGVVRTRVGTLEKRLDALEMRVGKNFEEIFKRLNSLEAADRVNEQQLGVMTRMMSPERIAQYQKDTATFQTKTEVRLDYIENGCSKCRGKTNA